MATIHSAATAGAHFAMPISCRYGGAARAANRANALLTIDPRVLVAARISANQLFAAEWQNLSGNADPRVLADIPSASRVVTKRLRQALSARRRDHR